MAGSPYEVRCPRCDVSFPVETKKCMHCGGATGPPGQFFSISRPDPVMADDSMDGAAVLGDLFSGRGPDTDSSEYEQAYGQGDDDPYAHSPDAGYNTGPESGSGGDSGREANYQAGAGDSVSDAESPGLAKTLVRSLGGFIWILLLIGFSIARDCGE